MNQESHFEKKKYFTLISFAAFSFVILALAFSLIGLWAQSINWYLSPYVAQGPHPSFWSIGMFFTITGIYGSVIGLIVTFVLLAYCMFKKIRGLIALLICLSFIISFCAFLIPWITHVRIADSPAKLYPYHLHSIGRTLEKYAKGHNGQLPGADNWCGTLLRVNSSLTPHDFRIDSTPKDSNMSDFAINPNVSESKLAELPKNTVLLFETPLAKNPAGGPELMSTNNHPIKGCFILFADMHIAFVRAEDFNNLRWKP
jgi:hypothetical protein